MVASTAGLVDIETLKTMLRKNYPIDEKTLILLIQTYLPGLKNSGLAYSISFYLDKKKNSDDFYRELFKCREFFQHYGTGVGWYLFLQFPETILRENEHFLSYPDAFSQKALPLDIGLKNVTVETSSLLIRNKQNEITEDVIRQHIDVLDLGYLIRYLGRKVPIDVVLDNYKKQKTPFSDLSCHPELPIDFVAERPSRFSWTNISIFHDLTDEFVEVFSEKIRWDKLSPDGRQKISKKMLEEHFYEIQYSTAFKLVFYNFPDDFERLTEEHIQLFSELTKNQMDFYLSENVFSLEFLKEHKKIFSKHQLKKQVEEAITRKEKEE